MAASPSEPSALSRPAASASPGEIVPLPQKSRDTLLQECGGLLHFLWLTNRAFDKSGVSSTNFEESFDFESAREVRHVVHGRPFGKFGEVKCSWLRVALKGMNELEMDEGEGEPITTYHGTRWPKLPWVLKDRCLKSGPREAGGKNGVWTSPVFKTAETYAWPEPLGSAAAPYFDPWAHLEDTSESDDRFQAVLELEVVQWRRHSKSVYVTNDERKAALTAVHVRCWRRGAEDHAELRQAYFPSSFMPNGGRLWFVAGSEPEWLEKEKGELADGTAAQTPKRPKKRKSIQKAPKKDPEDEADPEESNAAKKVSGSANDPKIGRTIWGQMETTMPAGELRDKLWKYLWRTYGSAVEQASTKPGPKPEIFLVLWLEEALRRLLQASWGSELLQPSNCIQIVEAMKLMLQAGLVPDQLDSAPTRRWSQQLQNQLHVALSAKLREQGSNGIPAE